jgi:hypothetical protein
MRRPRLGFRNQPDHKKLFICDRFIRGVAKAPADKRPLVRLAEMQSLLGEARQALQDVDLLRIELRAALGRKRRLVDQTCRAVTLGMLGFMGTTGDNATAYLGAGLRMGKSTHRRVGVPDAPAGLRLLPTKDRCTVRLGWKRSVRRCVFLVQMTTDPHGQDGWKNYATTSRQTITLTGLKPLVPCHIHLAALNAHGQSPWSQPVRAVVG